MCIKEQKVKPFIKWVGGKRQLLKEILKYAPREFNNYYEPFLGGGAVLYNIDFRNRAIVNDINVELTNTYNQVKNNYDALCVELLEHDNNNSKEHYYQVRAWDRDEAYPGNYSDVSRAARFIYLNKNGFNGMYRVNSNNEFNVPFAKDDTKKCFDEDSLKLNNEFLRNVEIHNRDFAQICDMAQAGDFVYLDPPYVPLSPTESFTSYTADGFPENDQVRLLNAMIEMNERGVHIMMSNSASEWVRQNYELNNFTVIEVDVNRSINSKATKRKGHKEYIVINYGEEIYND